MAPAQQEGLAERRRRRIIPIIDPRFQWKYTLIITALGVGITAIMGALLYKAHIDNTHLLALQENRALQEQVMRGDQIFLLYLLLLVLVMGAALAFWGLVVTHRISGPLYIVARYLAVLASGQYPDVRPLRKRDELQEFFATFEDAVNGLRERDMAALREIDATLQLAQNGLHANSKAGLEEALRAVQRYRDILAEATGHDREAVAVEPS